MIKKLLLLLTFIFFQKVVFGQPSGQQIESYHAKKSNRQIVEKNGKFGIVTYSAREQIIPYVYDEISFFTGGFASVKKDNLYGFIDSLGKVVVPIKYTNTKPFYKGFASVQSKGKWGVVDTLANPIISCKYDYVSNLEESYFRVNIQQKNELWGIFNKNGKAIVSTDNYTSIFPIKNGKAIVSKKIKPKNKAYTNEVSGLLNIAKNKLILPIKYGHIDLIAYQNEFYKASLKSYSKTKNDYALVSQKGEILTPHKFYGIEIFRLKTGSDFIDSDFFITHVKKGDHLLQGLINKNGKEILPNIYRNYDVLCNDFNEKMK